MKIFFYALREYDEQKYVEKFAKQISLVSSCFSKADY